MTPHILVRPLRDDVVVAARAHGYTPLQAHLLGGRIHDGNLERLPRRIQPVGTDLSRPDRLPDIDAAVDRIVYAIRHGERCVIASDHDCDGASGHAIAWTALVDLFGMPPERVLRTLSHKGTEGYGLSDAYTERLLALLRDEPSLILTIDQGSTDERNIRRLAQAGHCVICTDHHGVPPEGPPRSALATVNPVRNDSAFGDPTIAGCFVIWLVMARVREVLIEQGHLPSTTPRLGSILDLAAIGVVADCVDLGMTNNRIAVRQGLHLMNANPRPCWRAMRTLLKRSEPWDEQAAGWLLGPRVNSSGRLADALTSVAFLLSRTDDEALARATALNQANEERRAIQQAMLTVAMPMAQAAVDAGRYGLVLWFPEGHAGVHGVVASRITEAFGRPTICLSPFAPNPEVATGSIRTTERVNVLNALRRIAERAPGCLKSHGGHKGAGGLKTAREDIPVLADLWDAAVRECYVDQLPHPAVWTDGAVPGAMGLETLAEIAALSPFGRGFEAPIFSETLRVDRQRAVGDGRHLKLDLRRADGTPVPAIWFGAVPEGDTSPLQPGASYRFAFELDANEFRQQTSLQLRIKTAQAA
jgi:single-stranded-DNA-specific exonuclease